jgi:PAS domain S-box-containing protein
LYINLIEVDYPNYWAARNDTYTFITTGDPTFIHYNLASGSLTNESMQDIGIDLILFMDSYGQIVFGRYLNVIGNPEGIPKNLTEQLALYGFCLGCLDKKSKFAGTILLSGRPMLIVAQPITNNIRKSPSEGRVVLGRYLAKKEVSKLSDITRLNITIFPLGEERMPDDFKQVRTILSHGTNTISIRSLNETIIAGYTILRDTYGNPFLILRVDAPREIYQQGTKSMRNFIILFLAASLLFSILTLFYLDKSVLSRLIKLTTTITNIGGTQNATARVIVEGEDELAQLAVSINSMLTALEQSNVELRKSEQRYKAVVEEQPDLICRYLYNGTINFVNDAFCIFFSSKIDELIGKQIDQFKHNIHIRSAEELKSDLSTDSPSITYEGQAITPAGTHWILWTSHGIFDKSGALIEVQSIGRDITELKVAVDALRQLQRRQADIIDFLPEALLAIDLDSEVIVWNRAMEDLTGVKAKDILGKGNYEYSLPFYGIRRPILADMVLKPFEDFEREYKNFQKDGFTILGETYTPTLGRHGSYLLAKATALYDDIGNVIGVIESVRDMTQFRQMEHRLERSRTELQIASDIQKHFIPKKTPFIPNFELSAITKPAMEVGGDFYDFISLKDGKYGLVIADVAGKSIPAALFMALSRMIIRTSATHQLETTEVLEMLTI